MSKEKAAVAARLRAIADAVEAGELVESNITNDPSTVLNAQNNERSVNIRLCYVGAEDFAEAN